MTGESDCSMCGIAGIYNLPLDAEVTEAVSLAIADPVGLTPPVIGTVAIRVHGCGCVIDGYRSSTSPVRPISRSKRMA